MDKSSGKVSFSNASQYEEDIEVIKIDFDLTEGFSVPKNDALFSQYKTYSNTNKETERVFI